MGINTPVVDRVPTYPGRVRLVPVSGQANTYDMARADQPVAEGTPINKNLLDQKAYTLTQAVTVYVSTSGNDSTGDGTSGKPYKTINKALSTIPKNLGGFSATLNIAAGTYEEVVLVSEFHGGDIIFGGTAGAVVTVKRLIVVRSQLGINNIAFTVWAGEFIGIDLSRDALLVANTAVLIRSATNGLHAQTGGTAIFNAGIEINNCTSAAVRIGSMAKVYATALAGGGSALGISADTGAVFSYASGTINATTATRTATGGRILSGSQTSIPNY